MAQPVWLSLRQGSRNSLEIAADILVHRHLQRRAAQDHRHDLLLHRLAVNLVLHQRGEHVRALAVPDQHDAATVIVMRQIFPPRIAHIVVGEHAVGRDRLARHELRQRRKRHLTIHRRVDPALGGKARDLVDHHILLAGAGDHVAVGRRLRRDRGINIKAIDRRIGIRGPFLDRLAAVGIHHRRGLVHRARIGAAGAAEPGGGIGVIVGRGGGRRRLRIRCHAGHQSGAESQSDQTFHACPLPNKRSNLRSPCELNITGAARPVTPRPAQIADARQDRGADAARQVMAALAPVEAGLAQRPKRVCPSASRSMPKSARNVSPLRVSRTSSPRCTICPARASASNSATPFSPARWS